MEDYSGVRLCSLEEHFLLRASCDPQYTYDSSIDWTSWASWNKASSYTTDRAYNYVHVAPRIGVYIVQEERTLVSLKATLGTGISTKLTAQSFEL